MTDRHASVTDLPGYLTPATVAEILAFPGSYGFVWVPSGILAFAFAAPGIAQDGNGKLWANPKALLMRRQPDGEQAWAALAWTEHGLGVFVPQHSYLALARRKYGTEHLEGWVPVAEVLASAPGVAGPDSH